MKSISDIGRLIAVPVFSLIMVPGGCIAYTEIRTLLPVNMGKAISLANHLVLLSFYALLILLYFLRRPAKSSSRSFITNTIAITASFMPLFFLDLSGRTASNTAFIMAADIIILAGMAFAIYSLSILGQSFSIIPQARELVREGPYRVVRHPLYLGELISIFGVVLLNVTLLNLLVFLLLIACQVYRTLREEELLEQMFPEYKEYRSRTYRILPGIV